MHKWIIKLVLFTAMLASPLVPCLAEPENGFVPGRRLGGPFRRAGSYPGGPGGLPSRQRQAGIAGVDPHQSILTGSPTNQPSIITGDDSTVLHPKPQTPAPADVLGSSQRGFTLPVNTTRRNGTNFSRLPDGTRQFTTRDGKFGQISPDGTGARPDGSVVSKDAATGATSLSKSGYKLQHKQDGSTVFTRSNGIETEFKDGKARMKQDGQYTNREVKF